MWHYTRLGRYLFKSVMGILKCSLHNWWLLVELGKGRTQFYLRCSCRPLRVWPYFSEYMGNINWTLISFISFLFLFYISSVLVVGRKCPQWWGSKHGRTGIQCMWLGHKIWIFQRINKNVMMEKIQQKRLKQFLKRNKDVDFVEKFRKLISHWFKIILIIHRTFHETTKEERMDIDMNFEDGCIQIYCWKMWIYKSSAGYEGN